MSKVLNLCQKQVGTFKKSFFFMEKILFQWHQTQNCKNIMCALAWLKKKKKREKIKNSSIFLMCNNGPNTWDVMKQTPQKTNKQTNCNNNNNKNPQQTKRGKMKKWKPQCSSLWAVRVSTHYTHYWKRFQGNREITVQKQRIRIPLLSIYKNTRAYWWDWKNHVLNAISKAFDNM